VGSMNELVPVAKVLERLEAELLATRHHLSSL
jgi:hypothetical protein